MTDTYPPATPEIRRERLAALLAAAERARAAGEPLAMLDPCHCLVGHGRRDAEMRAMGMPTEYFDALEWLELPPNITIGWTINDNSKKLPVGSWDENLENLRRYIESLSI